MKIEEDEGMKIEDLDEDMQELLKKKPENPYKEGTARYKAWRRGSIEMGAFMLRTFLEIFNPISILTSIRPKQPD
jgi:hypothetical protein